MIAIIGGLINFLASAPELGANVWDGEIPRYDTTGAPINPSSGPQQWPVVKLYMEEGGFQRVWTTEDPYDDEGTIIVKVYATSRAQAEQVAGNVEAIFAQATNWLPSNIPLGGPLENPNYIIQLLLDRWYSGQEEGKRTGKSELIYRVDMYYTCYLHGAISTL